MVVSFMLRQFATDLAFYFLTRNVIIGLALLWTQAGIHVCCNTKQ